MLQEMPELRRSVTICNMRGLHARAASKFAKLARDFLSEVWVMREDMVVSAHSLMGLMMLGAGKGVAIELWARGEDASEAMAALIDLIERGFDEDDF